MTYFFLLIALPFIASASDLPKGSLDGKQIQVGMALHAEGLGNQMDTTKLTGQFKYYDPFDYAELKGEFALSEPELLKKESVGVRITITHYPSPVHGESPFEISIRYYRNGNEVSGEQVDFKTQDLALLSSFRFSKSLYLHTAHHKLDKLDVYLPLTSVKIEEE